MNRNNVKQHGQAVTGAPYPLGQLEQHGTDSLPHALSTLLHPLAYLNHRRCQGIFPAQNSESDTQTRMHTDESPSRLCLSRRLGVCRKQIIQPTNGTFRHLQPDHVGEILKEVLRQSNEGVAV